MDILSDGWLTIHLLPSVVKEIDAVEPHFARSIILDSDVNFGSDKKKKKSITKSVF